MQPTNKNYNPQKGNITNTTDAIDIFTGNIYGSLSEDLKSVNICYPTWQSGHKSRRSKAFRIQRLTDFISNKEFFENYINNA